MMCELLLPPWGVMEDVMMARIRDRPIPEAWLWPPGSTPNVPEWQAWRDEIIVELESLLWPVYDAALCTWTHNPSRLLIETDFKLIAQLRCQLLNAVKGLGKNPGIHLDFFNEEDDEKIIFGNNYGRYDPGLPEYLSAHFTDILWNGCDRKIGSLHFQLKQKFQRPRPFQVAAIQGRDYSYVWANTGGTPSFISGHCIQGSLAGCSAFALFGSLVDAVSVDVLKQFTVDIGDRRVYAGVHYPSDNLGSWFTALKLVPHVFDASVAGNVSAFLWDAIDRKSVVFAAIKEHVRLNTDSPYRPAVDAIKAIAIGT